MLDLAEGHPPFALFSLVTLVTTVVVAAVAFVVAVAVVVLSPSGGVGNSSSATSCRVLFVPVLFSSLSSVGRRFEGLPPHIDVVPVEFRVVEVRHIHRLSSLVAVLLLEVVGSV